jgi:uncharacterized protein Smg (DUF494 family)
MANYYDRIFRLCGFDESEINKERARIEKALQRIDFKPEDVDTAENWLKQNHDLNITGYA